MSIKQIGFLLLATSILLSSFFVIYAKHENRQAFVALQELKNEQYKMQTEWGQLQLEQATWATHSRLEKIAESDLGMKIPSLDAISIIKP